MDHKPPAGNETDLRHISGNSQTPSNVVSLPLPGPVNLEDFFGHSPSSAPELRVTATLEELMALEADWRKLEERAATPANVFQSYDWCANWARTYTATTDCYTLFVVTAYDNGEPVVIWPLMRTCAGPICVLRWLTDQYGQYGDVLVSPEIDASAWLPMVYERIRKEGGADAIRLRHVRKDSAVYQFVNTYLRAAGEPDCAPCLDLSEYPDENAYNGRYSKVQRRRRKKIRQKLEQRGRLSFELLKEGYQFETALHEAISEKRKWLASRGLQSPAVFSDSIETFLLSLAGTPGAGVQVSTSRMQTGDEPVSYEIALRYKGHHFGFITSHKSNLTDVSPARLHMDLSQRQAINDGCKAFDLMVPGDAHKASWSNQSMPVHDYYASLSARGRLYGYLYLETLRPMLRRLYFASPVPVRRYLQSLTNNK